mmetsp:Transcript_11464/g.28954  ORF Transcript_11464/g.28954 Transcript_11464/m.28954 type:complete len:220 (+) Transcript_11464:1112-1771(+)
MGTRRLAPSEASPGVHPLPPLQPSSCPTGIPARAPTAAAPAGRGPPRRYTRGRPWGTPPAPPSAGAPRARPQRPPPRLRASTGSPPRAPTAAAPCGRPAPLRYTFGRPTPGVRPPQRRPAHSEAPLSAPRRRSPQQFLVPTVRPPGAPTLARSGCGRTQTRGGASQVAAEVRRSGLDRARGPAGGATCEAAAAPPARSTPPAGPTSRGEPRRCPLSAAP